MDTIVANANPVPSPHAITPAENYAHLLETVRKSMRQAQVMLTDMNKWKDELAVLFMIPNPTQEQRNRLRVVENALLEYDGYFRDGGKLPASEYITEARKRAA